MFVGHYAPALWLRRRDPRLPLGALLLAAQGPDLLLFALAPLGVERFAITSPEPGPLGLDLEWMPWSHSLAGVAAAALLLGVACRLAGRARLGGALAICWLSHWPLDWLVHRPDLPLVPGGGSRVGLALWRLPVASFALELAVLWAAALAPGPEPRRARRLALPGALTLAQALRAFVLPLPADPVQFSLTALVTFAAVAGLGALLDRR